jgi:hypothetical protein
MKQQSLINRAGRLFVLPVLLFSFFAGSAQKPAVKNIVLVHGAFADGSGWE